MDTLLIMLKNVIIFVLLAIPGYLLVKGKLLDQKSSGIISKLLTYVGMPFMILSSTLKLEFTGEFTISLIAFGVVCIGFTFLMFFASGWLAGWDSNKSRSGMMRFCMVFANNGFIGIPLARAVFGEDSPVMAYLIISNITMNVMMFSLGPTLISGDKKSVNIKKALFTPVFIAFVAGIVLNLTKVCGSVPEIQTYVGHFGGIVTPLSMVVLGIKLADVPMKRLLTSGHMYYVSLLRLVLFTVVGIALMFGLQFVPVMGFGADAIIAFFMGFAMPTAGLASVFADQHKGDSENAVIFTLGTTILSVVTIPVLYWILRMIV